MNRDPKARGRVRLIDNRWIGRMVLRVTDPATGKRRRRDLRVVLGTIEQLRTEAAAQRAFDRHLERLKLHRLPASGRMSFRDFVAQRFEFRMSSFAANTAARYRSELRKHLVPALGDRPLAAVDLAALQDLAAKLHAAGKQPGIIAALMRLAARVLQVAADENLIPAAPDVRRLALPRDSRAPTAPRAFSQDDVQRILAAASGWRRALYALLAGTGLRIGEALGTEWPDIDLIGGTLRVRQQSVRGHLVKLKSRTSAAVLPLARPLQDLLSAYHADCGSPSQGLLFPGRNGAPLSTEGIRKGLRSLLAALGIPQAGCHAFRHGFVTQLARSGAPLEAVRRLARHSNYSLTLRYSQSFPVLDLRAAIDHANES